MFRISDNNISSKAVKSFIRAIWISKDFMDYVSMSEWVTSTTGLYKHQSDLCWLLNIILKIVILGSIFKRVDICPIFISQWVVKA